MIPSAGEIEIIVRRVLASYTQSPTSETLADAHGSMLTGVISVQSIRESNIVGPTLLVANSAVMTPAAIDYCRDHKIEVIRQNSVTTTRPASKTTAIGQLIVAGTAPWMPNVAKQLCPKQNTVLEPLVDDASVLDRLSREMVVSNQAGIAVVTAPHAFCWQAARNQQLRPVVASNWYELGEILREVPVNLLILSTKTWNAASTCNAAKRFLGHLQSEPSPALRPTLPEGG